VEKEAALTEIRDVGAPNKHEKVGIRNIYPIIPSLHLPNLKDPHPATYKFIDAIDIPPFLA
jgi:hypothetical protein